MGWRMRVLIFFNWANIVTVGAFRLELVLGRMGLLSVCTHAGVL